MFFVDRVDPISRKVSMALLRSTPSLQKMAVINYEDCPAKTWTKLYNNQDTKCLGRSVLDHCLIVHAVAKEWISRLPPELQGLFPQGSAFAAGCHDIGKVSPFFYEKIRLNCLSDPSLAEHPLVALNLNPDLENQWGGHAGVSQLCASYMGSGEEVSKVLGQHHGYSPVLGARHVLDETFGGRDWQYQRERLVQEIQARTQETWPQIQGAEKLKLISGLATVADWIGSGHHFEDPRLDWRPLISKAVDDAGFLPPQIKKGLSFQEIFNFHPREAQSVLCDAVRRPGVYLLEASMGMGKTEAALFSAYQMLQSGLARGIYFALPTQLTSNKIFDRFNYFLSKILDNQESGAHATRLLHAGSWMLESEMGEDAKPGGEWFSPSKRGLLAPFAVGTVDQALMAAMHVKHGFVRSFGLAGKVVILDEVHTYDSYTGKILDHLVNGLQQLGCTVILLSATLSSDRRSRLFSGQIKPSKQYPLVTSKSVEDSVNFHPITPDLDVSVAVSLCQHREKAIEEVIERSMNGQRILWIENTVDESQEIFSILKSRLPNIPIGLLHSRFTASARSLVEKEWVPWFGKEGWGDRLTSGCILVGTQILEQSLDLDSDFMVTAFAPSDLMLQRLGRLWRHADTPRNPSAVREAWVVAPKLENALSNPQTAFGSSSFVYDPYILCRSLEVWSQKQSINIPSQIRDIVEETYQERVETDDRFSKHLHHMLSWTKDGPGKLGLERLANGAVSSYGTAMKDEFAPTRYAERQQKDVLLVSSIKVEGKNTKIVFMDQSHLSIPHQRSTWNSKEWRKAALVIARQTVRVPEDKLPSLQTVSFIQSSVGGIKHACFLGEDPSASSKLFIYCVGQDTVLREVNGSSLAASVRYSKNLGLKFPLKQKKEQARG